MSDKQAQSKTGEFCWNELITGDVAKAKEFYGKLLGWEHEDVNMGEFTYTLFKQGDKQVCGMMQSPQAGTPPHWMSYISVADIQAALKKAKSLGAEEVVPVTPVGDFGKLFVVKDPTGAHIAFWESLKK